MQVKIAGRSIHAFHILAIAAILPLVIAAIFAGIVRLSNLNRFDPAYFTSDLIGEYGFANAAAIDLEKALRENDSDLLVKLEGLRQPVIFTASKKTTIERVTYTNNDRYREVMMIDRGTYRARRYHLGLEQGRWVVVPDDTYYYLDSGRWLAVWLPPSIIWWLAETTVTLMMLIWYFGGRFRRDWAKRHSAS